jgi:hypothetical protein
MRKVRRQAFEQRVRDFVDAAQFVTDRPLLLWSPRLDKITKSLVKEVARIIDRQRAWEKR